MNKGVLLGVASAEEAEIDERENRQAKQRADDGTGNGTSFTVVRHVRGRNVVAQLTETRDSKRRGRGCR